MMAVALMVIATNSPARTHAVAVRLMSAHVGYGATLDATATATVAADIAAKSQLIVASDATKTATSMNAQTALDTSDDDTLAKRQVVSTAGNVTRDITGYSVQSGDTLSMIASKFDITTDTILWANNLSDANSIKPGQALTILPVSGLLYTVASGDTAASLASAYQANAAQILSYNDDEVTGLAVGEKIIIPDGVKPTPVVAAPAVQSLSTAAYTPALTNFSYSGNGYAYGYCTWYVASRRNVPSYWGNAVNWYYNAQISGFSVGSTPEVGAIAWTGAGYLGHVAYVESVSGGNVTISEMNGTAGWGRVDTRTVPASSFRYIY
jgi:surface antigen